MQAQTLTTIQSILAIDPEVTEAQRQSILKTCRSKSKQKDLISPKEAAEILGCCRLTLRKYQNRGLLHPIYHSARKIRFDRDEVQDLLYNGVNVNAGE